MKKIISLVLALIMVVPMLSTVAEAAITETEYGLIYFENFEDLKELSKGSYALFEDRATYQGEGPLVIEEDLVLPDYLDITFTDLVIPEDVTLTGKERSTSITVMNGLTVNGTLEWDSQMTVYGNVDISGSVVLDGRITLSSGATITGGENVRFEYNGAIQEQCYPTTVDEIKEILKRANFSTQWELQIIYWSYEDMRIEESLTFPENCNFEAYTPKLVESGAGGVLTIGENCTVTFNCPVHIECGINVEGTLEYNGKDKMYISCDRGGKLSFAENGKFAGEGDIQISGTNLTGPEQALPGMDFSIFKISETTYGGYLLENVGGVVSPVEPAKPVKLGTPTNLHWDEEKNGYINFHGEVPTTGRYGIAVYRTDSGEVYFYMVLNTGDTTPGEYSTASFAKDEKMVDGNYYFTVKALGDGERYLDSDIAASPVWEYKKPANKIDTPKILGWNGTKACFEPPAERENIASYSVNFYFAETITETPRIFLGFDVNDPNGTERELDELFMADMGEGYFYYTVQANSKNVALVSNSDLSEMSGAYYYNPGHTHSFDSWKVVKEASCEEDGSKQRSCLCGTTESEDIPATGHTEVVDAAVEVSCTVDGKSEGSHCSVCKKVIKEQVVAPALGHDYVNGICSRCNRPETAETARLAGNSRYETSFAIANEMKEVLGIDKFDTIILASSDNFADALAGSYLAAQKQAPIIICKQKYAGIVCDYVNSNLASGGKVYVLGGEGAVPGSVLSGITVTGNFVRLAGEERYDTNLAILEEAGIGSNDLLVATGRDFADSLSASATGLPILLVNGKAGKSLSADQKAFLKTVKGNIYIIGGESAVPEALKSEIENASGKTAARIAGGSRYETSVKIAQQFFHSADSAVVAYASTFPDGLCGGPLAYVLDAPLLLTKNGKPEAPGYTAKNGIVSGYVLGGTGLISDAFAAEIFAY